MKPVFTPAESTCLPVSGDTRCFPVHRVYCVGRNYADHALEMGGAPDREPPFFFSKPADAVTTRTTIPYPPMTHDLHHEVELVIALSGGGNEVDVQDAEGLIFGYAVGVDLTRRDLQEVAKKQGRPWDVAKGFDCSAPISSITPAAEIGHPVRGAITLSVNGQEKQRGDLKQMIWSVAEIIAGLSCYFELKAGDLIFTGTPAGVSALQPGDRIDCGVEGVGRFHFTLENG